MKDNKMKTLQEYIDALEPATEENYNCRNLHVLDRYYDKRGNRKDNITFQVKDPENVKPIVQRCLTLSEARQAMLDDFRIECARYQFDMDSILSELSEDERKRYWKHVSETPWRNL